jgi:hypothetical protein
MKFNLISSFTVFIHSLDHSTNSFILSPPFLPPYLRDEQAESAEVRLSGSQVLWPAICGVCSARSQEAFRF